MISLLSFSLQVALYLLYVTLDYRCLPHVNIHYIGAVDWIKRGSDISPQ